MNLTNFNQCYSWILIKKIWHDTVTGNVRLFSTSHCKYRHLNATYNYFNPASYIEDLT